MYELTPTDGRKSFYGKARVIEGEGMTVLMSYTTPVMAYDKATNTLYQAENHPAENASATTLRHMNAFAIHVGHGAHNKRDCMALPMKNLA